MRGRLSKSVPISEIDCKSDPEAIVAIKNPTITKINPPAIKDEIQPKTHPKNKVITHPITFSVIYLKPSL